MERRDGIGLGRRAEPVNGHRSLIVFAALAPLLLVGSGLPLPSTSHSPSPVGASVHERVERISATPVDNFTSAVQRLVTLLALSASGLLAIVWARVALSWFSNDVTKKIQAKDRARDALVGTVLFTAAISGLLWGLAHWVVTGT